MCGRPKTAGNDDRTYAIARQIAASPFDLSEFDQNPAVVERHPITQGQAKRTASLLVCAERPYAQAKRPASHHTTAQQRSREV